MFDLADVQQYLERPVEYWQDFGRRCALHVQQLARMTAETGLQMSPERAQAFVEGMWEACAEGSSSS